MSFGCDSWSEALQTTVFNNNPCINSAGMKQCTYITNGIHSFLFGRQQLALVKASNSSQLLPATAETLWQFSVPDKKMENPVIFVDYDRWGVVDSMHSDRRVFFKVDQGNVVKGLCLQSKQPLLALLSNSGSVLWDVDSGGSMPFNSDSTVSPGFNYRGDGSAFGAYVYGGVAAVLGILTLGLCYWQYKVRKQRRGKASQPLSIALQSISVVHPSPAAAAKTSEANQSVVYTASVPAPTGAKPAE
ncbi:hypothetical protein BJ741DRAFT_593639 [Chytriomyces cf. hyalinus JEL632]|nr:hypothetical protein BJ741DRAFT_593639 [Chytriomyces cf. hyalinus JEL632]